VADWRPAAPAHRKLKKAESAGPPSIQLIENPDVLAAVATLRPGPYCVGFAAESHDVVEQATAKLRRKGIPLIVANHGPSAFGADQNRLTLIDERGALELPGGSKLALARRLVAEIADRLAKERT
jgi:phosphopantothenoylcysteine decarboxylase/phosphopantothenate--cysteine ligase